GRPVPHVRGAVALLRRPGAGRARPGAHQRLAARRRDTEGQPDPPPARDRPGPKALKALIGTRNTRNEALPADPKQPSGADSTAGRRPDPPGTGYDPGPPHDKLDTRFRMADEGQTSRLTTDRMQPPADRGSLPPPLDFTRPSVARVYDYLLGGKNNFPVDRAV